MFACKHAVPEHLYYSLLLFFIIIVLIVFPIASICKIKL